MVQPINTDSSHVHNTAETQTTVWDSGSVYWVQQSRFLLSSDQGHRTSFWNSCSYSQNKAWDNVQNTLF